jgi:predicted nucleic acid-binding protein
MSDAPARPVVLDAGALLAAERNDRRFHVLFREMLVSGRIPLVPAPVLAQVWRGGARQANLSRLLRGCRIEPTDEATARGAGVLLGKAGTADAVDAIVVATALTHHALVITSDPGDLAKLTEAGPAGLPLPMIVV